VSARLIELVQSLADQQMFKNVVVSIDGSEPSPHALAVAADIAQRYGARLTIVHAVTFAAFRTNSLHHETGIPS